MGPCLWIQMQNNFPSENKPYPQDFLPSCRAATTSHAPNREFFYPAQNLYVKLRIVGIAARGEMMKKLEGKSGKRERVFGRAFRITLYLKGLDGLLELIGGLLLLLIPPCQIGALILFATQHELSEDPQDLVANALVQSAQSLSISASLFGAVYLLLHGVFKIVLVWAVLRDLLWAYPWMITFLLIFIAYQTYRLTTAFSVGMLGLTLFDILVLWLTWYEYRVHKQRQTS